jgi:biopolymer transport protein ExbD
MTSGGPGSIPAAASGLAERLGSGGASDVRIVIDADDAVPYELVVQANEACRSAGFEHVAVR